MWLISDLRDEPILKEAPVGAACRQYAYAPRLAILFFIQSQPTR